MQNILKKIALYAIILTVLASIFPHHIYALQCRDGSGSITAAPAGGTCPANTTAIAEITDFETIFANIVTIAGILLGVAFFGMLVMGGVRYLMSGGDPKVLQAAKGTITWAIIGLALFAISFTVLIIIEAFTGVDVSVFRIVN